MTDDPTNPLPPVMKTRAMWRTLNAIAAAWQLRRGVSSDMTDATIKVSDEQIAFYHREGYLTLPQITTADEVQWLRGIYDRLFATRAGRQDGNQFDLGGSDEEGKEARLPQILNPVKYAPDLAEGLFRANAFSIAKQLLG